MGEMNVLEVTAVALLQRGVNGDLRINHVVFCQVDGMLDMCAKLVALDKDEEGCEILSRLPKGQGELLSCH
jgi:hypothetical protein